MSFKWHLFANIFTGTICILVFYHIQLWKVWTQESFQKVEFDRPGERSPE